MDLLCNPTNPLIPVLVSMKKWRIPKNEENVPIFTFPLPIIERLDFSLILNLPCQRICIETHLNLLVSLKSCPFWTGLHTATTLNYIWQMLKICRALISGRDLSWNVDINDQCQKPLTCREIDCVDGFFSLRNRYSMIYIHVTFIIGNSVRCIDDWIPKKRRNRTKNWKKATKLRMLSWRPWTDLIFGLYLW